MKAKNLLMLLMLLISSMFCFAQTDTLMINNEKISCSVNEITADAVKFKYPGEEMINTVYKNTVQKIIFKSGRVQTFVEATSYKKVDKVDDYENITTTSVESEIKGLFKLGDVSSKAKGTTAFSNQERVKARAYKKMKIQAAMMGGNIVFLTNQRSEGNKYGGYFQSGSTAETSLTGIAYTNQLPNIDDFKKLINNKTTFSVIEEYKMWASDSDLTKSTAEGQFTITNIVNDNGIITLEGQLLGIKKYNKFKLANFNSKSFSIYYQDKSTAYNYTVQVQ
ncbi:hypothetical protein D3C87_216180 [compost metagenome]